MVLAMAGALALAWPVLPGTPAVAAPAQNQAAQSTAGPDRLPCDLPRYISINDVRSYESTGGGFTTFVFVVETFGCTHAASVGYTTSNGTANSSDFTATSGTLTWAAGDTSARAITVMVNRDSIDESNETFSVSLTQINGFTSVNGPGLGTILDDDGPVSWNINDVQCHEGDPSPAARLCTFTITLSQPTPVAKTVHVSTANQTATSPADYIGFVNKPVSVLPGSDIVQSTVELKPDDVCEANETLTLTLSSPSAGSLADPAAVMTIAEDDFFCDL
jgi:hypothetical protein